MDFYMYRKITKISFVCLYDKLIYGLNFIYILFLKESNIYISERKLRTEAACVLSGEFPGWFFLSAPSIPSFTLLYKLCQLTHFFFTQNISNNHFNKNYDFQFISYGFYYYLFSQQRNKWLLNIIA